jgi:hypothetical protein
VVGQSLTYTFTGIGIEVYGSLDTPATKGIPGVQFQIDRNPVETLNSTATPLTYHLDQITTHQILFQANNLNAGQHTITISITDTTDNGPFFYFDFFTVQTGMDSVAGHVILDDKDSGISYVPQWTNPGVPDEYLGGTSQSAGTGSLATVDFNGTFIVHFRISSTPLEFLPPYLYHTCSTVGLPLLEVLLTAVVHRYGRGARLPAGSPKHRL